MAEKTPTVQKTQVELINLEINKELSDESTSRALLATTFKGLDPLKMKQAILEGMLRGFIFQDFLQKNVYAIPFSGSYSLITSIDYARKLGMRGGVNGKSAPIYVDDKDGNILSCSVTIYKKGGHPGGYTATVYFKEYTTGRNLWTTKPRTMIAKVAEMHALRMACPEEMQQLYVSEEIEQEKKETNKTVTTEPVNETKWRDKLKKFLKENPSVSEKMDYTESLETEELAQSTYTRLLSEAK